MKRIPLFLLVAVLLIWSAAAQTAATQAQGSASGKAAVEAGKGAQAQTSTSVSASQGATVSGQKPEAKDHSAETHAKAGDSQHASAEAGGSSASLASGSTIQAVLSKPVDARKARAGDEVAAKTTSDVKSEGKVVIPKGSRLIGHVTQAKARAKGESESVLGLAFDKAVLKNGQEMPVHMVIQAIGAAQANAAAIPMAEDTMGSAGASGSAMTSTGARSGGGLVGSTLNTATGTAGAAVNTVGNTAGQVGSTGGATLGAGANMAGSAAGSTLGAALNSTSSGVVGLPGLALKSDAASSTQGSVIASTSRNVRLEGGTEMILRVTNQ